MTQLQNNIAKGIYDEITNYLTEKKKTKEFDKVSIFEATADDIVPFTWYEDHIFVNQPITEKYNLYIYAYT